MTPALDYSAINDCRDALARIDDVLTRHRPFWQARPFSEQSAPDWIAEHPALAKLLMGLDDDSVDRLQGSDAALLDALENHFPVCADIRQLIALPAASQPQCSEPPAGIPGNKWRQIDAFVAAASPLRAPYFEWCCGKSFLGEALVTGCFANAEADPVLSGVDIDAALLEAARHRAVPKRQLICADVLSNDLSGSLHHDHHLLGLHACGGLHQRMLSLGAEQQCHRISLSPCCYHRFIADYQPLSQFLRAASLRVSADDLRLAVRQSKTARRGERDARRQLQVWHLALLEQCQQQGRELSRFQSLPHSAVKRGFDDFCRRQLAANQYPEDLVTVNDVNMDAAELRLRNAERLGLAAMVFRRLLELRCVLDSAQYLCEQGYVVALTQFCDSAISPRNILIDARRDDSSGGKAQRESAALP
ncbi:MAG: methyltransferase [Spongiibacter sp.]|nr:methyltransferase [Spongiibacter sp.]